MHVIMYYGSLCTLYCTYLSEFVYVYVYRPSSRNLHIHLATQSAPYLPTGCILFNIQELGIMR